MDALKLWEITRPLTVGFIGEDHFSEGTVEKESLI
jgi:hypothetical protein